MYNGVMNRKDDPIKICAQCEKQFFRVYFGDRLQDLGSFKKRKFCSKICQLEYQLKAEQTRQWIGRKLQSFKKDKCATCKGNHWIGVHHRDGNWKNNDISNLITLCASCHSKLHHSKGDYEHIYEKKTCTICGLPHKAKGLCNKHYRNWKNTGYAEGKRKGTQPCGQT